MQLVLIIGMVFLGIAGTLHECSKAELVQKKEEALLDICASKSESPGEFEKCLRRKE